MVEVAGLPGECATALLALQVPNLTGSCKDCAGAHSIIARIKVSGYCSIQYGLAHQKLSIRKLQQLLQQQHKRRTQ
jgi:hypothetical protein